MIWLYERGGGTLDLLVIKSLKSIKMKVNYFTICSLVACIFFTISLTSQIEPNNPNPNHESDAESIYQSRILKVFDSGLIRTSPFSMNDVGGEESLLALFSPSEGYSYREVDVLQHAFRDHKISKFQQLYNGVPIEGSYLTLIGSDINARPNWPEGGGPGGVGPCDQISFIKPPKNNTEALSGLSITAFSDKVLAEYLGVKSTDIFENNKLYALSDGSDKLILVQDIRYIENDMEYIARFDPQSFSFLFKNEVRDNGYYKSNFESDNVFVKDNINDRIDPVFGDPIQPFIWDLVNGPQVRDITPTACESGSGNIFPRNLDLLWEIALNSGQVAFDQWEEIYETGYDSYYMSLHEISQSANRNARYVDPGSDNPNQVITAFRIFNPNNQHQALESHPALQLEVQWHEIGHKFLIQNDLENAALVEGLADILSYIAADIDGISSYVIFERDLGRAACVNNVGTSSHSQGIPLGSWFFSLSQSIGIEASSDLFFDILDLLPNGDFTYEEFMLISLELALERWGVCSSNFENFINEWKDVCLDVPHPVANGQPCVKQTLASNHTLNDQTICEEHNGFNIVLEGNGGLSGLDDDRNTWRIIGLNSTEFESELGMSGNSQQGGFGLNITNIPEFPYYPQQITVEVYVAEIGDYISSTWTILDCDGDDPTCEKYHNLSESQLPSDNEHLDGLDFINEENSEYSYSVYYDLMGNKIFDNNIDSYYKEENHNLGIIVKLDFDVDGRLLKTTKQLNSFN